MPQISKLDDILGSQVIEQLQQNAGIYSVEELFTTESSKLTEISGLTQKDLNIILENVLNVFAAPSIKGSDHLGKTLNESAYYATGSQHVDELLGGGFMTGEIVELVGPVASGKTQMCLTSAINIVSRTNGTVFYIDTSNSFDAERLQQLYIENEDDDVSVSLEASLNKIRCVKCFGVFVLLDILQNIIDEIEKNESLFHQQLRMIVVDSISGIFSPIVGSGSASAILLSHAGRILKNIAVQYDIAIVVNNYTVSHIPSSSSSSLSSPSLSSSASSSSSSSSSSLSSSSIKPALGEGWGYVASTRLLLNMEFRKIDPSFSSSSFSSSSWIQNNNNNMNNNNVNNNNNNNNIMDYRNSSFKTINRMDVKQRYATLLKSPLRSPGNTARFVIDHRGVVSQDSSAPTVDTPAGDTSKSPWHHWHHSPHRSRS